MDHHYVQIGGSQGTGLSAPIETGLSSNLGKHGGMHEGPVPVRIVVDGAKVETYVGEQSTGRLADAVLPRSDALYIINSYVASEEYPLYVGSLRIVTVQE